MTFFVRAEKLRLLKRERPISAFLPLMNGKHACTFLMHKQPVAVEGQNASKNKDARRCRPAS